MRILCIANSQGCPPPGKENCKKNRPRKEKVILVRAKTRFSDKKIVFGDKARSDASKEEIAAAVAERTETVLLSEKKGKERECDLEISRKKTCKLIQQRWSSPLTRNSHPSHQGKKKKKRGGE